MPFRYSGTFRTVLVSDVHMTCITARIVFAFGERDFMDLGNLGRTRSYQSYLAHRPGKIFMESGRLFPTLFPCEKMNESLLWACAIFKLRATKSKAEKLRNK